MAFSKTPPEREPRARRLALGGALWGVAASMVLGGFLFAGEEPRTGETLTGDAAQLFLYLAPFILSLLALRLEEPACRAGLWGGCGLLALIASFTSFSGVTLLLLPAGVLLLVAAGRLRASVLSTSRAIAIGLAVATVLTGIGAALALFVREDPRCWTRTGTGAWNPAPVRGDFDLVLEGEATEGVCKSDVATAGEAGLSAGIWVGAGLSLLAAGRSGR